MHEPSEFYQSLLGMIRRAESRIFLSSLYIGSKEGELVDALYKALQDKPTLHVRLHLDLNRSTRPGPDSTARILLPLLSDFPDRIRVCMFRSPKLKGLMAKLVPPRFNEGWGTWHPKIYGTDDEVIISGANLNSSYFTNRQDRYIHIRSHPHLSQYCFAFLHACAGFTYRLSRSTSSPRGYALRWDDKDVHPHHIEPKARRTLLNFQKAYRLASAARLPILDHVGETPLNDVLIFPVIQAGQFGIREEERALSLLFDQILEQKDTLQGVPVVDITSGYFGIYKNYCDLVLRSHIGCRILAASPKANGFYGSRGISGRIPEGYTLLEQRFMQAVQDAGRMPTPQHPGVSLQEWERDGWTYHAKGLWLRPNESSDPYLTLFGSTNLNSRSANLDTELSFVLATTSENLRQRLSEEAANLWSQAQPWRGNKRPVRLGTKALVAAVGGML
ncbi:hypothetical protein NM688_g3961 [Phlebia brevispora]|uniref:Uncharacterized protein n=1 Tax=Phlebia brevispora TaxID=194682 RepID=A0ACC1T434_9APHY|nr:hypothetical protein NM688_g3961 [Phlebia brevispora]